MAQSNLKTTRIELIKTKGRIRVASKGLNLLKMKRSSLVLEFFDLARQIKALRGNLYAMVSQSIESIKLAEMVSGRINLERIAAEQSNISAKVSAKNVMGVKIPNINLNGYAAMPMGYELISVPTSIEDAKRSYQELFMMLIEIAEKENSLRKLLHEIEKLNRRSNAIENVAIPNLKSKVSYIKQRLEDLERDQIVSLKFIKGKLNENV
ncbi:MAG: V-type ATP synthase subunit D [Candidatus Marsarchaeota archaeon]|nr:V-type ATP synthase subunit D [Candidatus Marsarchaeota archaeon]